MGSLESRLAELRAQTSWPATPDVVPRVLAAIDAERAAGVVPPATRKRWLRPLPALGIALLLLLAATAAVPPARSAVLRWLGIKGTTIHRVERLPHATTGAPLHLGSPTSLAAAQRAAGFRIRVPRSLGASDQVLVAKRGATHAVTLLYRPRAGLPALPGQPQIGALLTEFIGRSTPFIDKMIPEAARVVPATVAGHRGYWLEDPHVVIVQYGAGAITPEPRRRVGGSVLLWEAPPLSLRLESRLDRAKAVALAGELH
jgi:hypothetical protein